MKPIPSARTSALAAVLGLLFAAAPVPAVALSTPRALSAARTIGIIDGAGPVTDPRFPVDYLGLSWREGPRPYIRFLDDGRWTPWGRVLEDEIPTIGGRTWSALVPAGDADAYQVRGENTGVRAFAINTTDGPRSLEWETPEAEATHIVQPPLITRAGWGADESLRCNPDGTPKFSWTFYSTQKLIVHHTATANDDPDPAATVRAIYVYHVVNRGFIDIAYNFLVDAQGNIYKGRYSGPNGTCYQDTLTGEDPQSRGVSGAHTGGWNSGTMGIAVLGTYTSVPIPDPARQALIHHLAWEAEHHGLDPLATTTFTNPASGDTNAAPNISGHRDWTVTECPGEILYQTLPTIRQEVAAFTGPIAPPDTEPPRISEIEARRIRRMSAIIRWRTNEPATSRVIYWAAGSKHRRTPTDQDLTPGHRVRLHGLEPGTHYLFRPVSRDEAGNIANGRTRHFDTQG